MRVSKNWVKFNKMFTLSPCLKYLVDAGLEVVVDALAWHAAPVVKGRIVSGKHHLLGFG